MSLIGLSPGIRPGSAYDTKAVRAVGSSDHGPAPQPAEQPAVAPSTPLDAGPVPVDQARVASIKKAIATNSYPLNPARIGDAMIAAGLLLRMPK